MIFCNVMCCFVFAVNFNNLIFLDQVSPHSNNYPINIIIIFPIPVCVENGTIYQTGSAMTTSSLCSYCYCINGKQKCVKPKCLLPKAPTHCSPIYIEGSCCPIKYDCNGKAKNITYSTNKWNKHKQQQQQQEEDEASSQMEHFDNLSDSQKMNSCQMNSRFFIEGQKLPKDDSDPCSVCYCIRGKRKCTPKKCAPTIRHCMPIIPAGQCCPSGYDCNVEAREKSRQFDLFSLFFGADENATEAQMTETTTFPPFVPLATGTAESTSEKSFFDVIRDGLNFVDANEQQIGGILGKPENVSSVPPNKPELKETNHNIDGEEDALDSLLEVDESTDSYFDYEENDPMMVTVKTEEDDEEYDDDEKDLEHLDDNRITSSTSKYFHTDSSSLGTSKIVEMSTPAMSKEQPLVEFKKLPELSKVQSEEMVEWSTKPMNHITVTTTRPNIIQTTKKHIQDNGIVKQDPNFISKEPLRLDSTFNQTPSVTNTENVEDKPGKIELTKKTNDLHNNLTWNQLTNETNNLVAEPTTNTTTLAPNTESIFSAFFSGLAEILDKKFNNETVNQTKVSSSTITPKVELTTVRPQSTETLMLITRPSTTTRTPIMRETPSKQTTGLPIISTTERISTSRATTTTSTRKTTTRPTTTRSSTTTSPPNSVQTSIKTSQSTTIRPATRPPTTFKRLPEATVSLLTSPTASSSIKAAAVNPSPTTRTTSTTEKNVVQGVYKNQYPTTESQTEQVPLLTPIPLAIPPLTKPNLSSLDTDYHYDYSEPTLPPSLPNLKIIPFLPTDAVKNDRKKPYDYYKINPSSYPAITTEIYERNKYMETPVFSQINLGEKRIDYSNSYSNKDLSHEIIKKEDTSNVRGSFESYPSIANADHSDYDYLVEGYNKKQGYVEDYPGGKNNYDVDVNSYMSFKSGPVYKTNPGEIQTQTEKTKPDAKTEMPTFNYDSLNNRFSPPKETEGKFLS